MHPKLHSHTHAHTCHTTLTCISAAAFSSFFLLHASAMLTSQTNTTDPHTHTHAAPPSPASLQPHSPPFFRCTLLPCSHPKPKPHTHTPTHMPHHSHLRLCSRILLLLFAARICHARHSLPEAEQVPSQFCGLCAVRLAQALQAGLHYTLCVFVCVCVCVICARVCHCV